MTADIKYMQRCIQLASKGRGHTSPNPMVGAVVVHNDKIIGEGFHRKAGEPHAEVNAINNVKDKILLKKSTLYVSLEPCSHYGKTPPCAELIIRSEIPKVVIGCLDPYPKVAGRGVEMLIEAGVDTKVGVLEDACKELNKEFNTVYAKNRPYVYLKWAQSKDGFIDKVRSSENMLPASLSNEFTRLLVHKMRAEADAIMVATNTVIADNPSLTTRLWWGSDPMRVILDKTLRIPTDFNVFDESVETLIITEAKELPEKSDNLIYYHIDYDNDFLHNLFNMLKTKNVNSLMIEGGSTFLQYIIDRGIWDEAFVETANVSFYGGVKAPVIVGKVEEVNLWFNSIQTHFRKTQN